MNYTEKVLNIAANNMIRAEAQHAFISRSPSKAIPIKGSSMQRTYSELQLMEDEKLAEHRDYRMYKRIVKGMVSRQNSNPYNVSWTSNEILDNIIRTRHTPVTMLDGCQDIIDQRNAYPVDSLQHTQSFRDHHNNSLPQESHHLINHAYDRQKDTEIFELDM